MTRIKKLPALLLIVATSTIVAAQTRTQAQTEWQRMFDMGLKYGTALELYTALKSTAHGGLQSPPFARLPDWNKGKELDANGISYDENLSECGPPGFPRWLVIPFLREFIVRPEQTWLSSETVNNVRRIYTDGRNHPPVEDRFPLYYGDSIGFWDDQKLVIHTNQLMKRSMGRNEPEQSEQMETVEIWEKTDARTIEAKVWIYDPALYLEPWYLTRRYTQVANTDKSVRMNYWHCGENPNNDVYKTPDGSTQFREFTFSPKDKR